MKSWILALFIAGLAVPAAAEFTEAEKAEWRESYVASAQARDAGRQVAKAIKFGTTTESRSALASALDATFRVIAPINAVPVYIVHGSMSGFPTFTQLGSYCNAISQDAPQADYLACAWGAADIALSRFDAAQLAIAEARVHHPGDSVYQGALVAAGDFLVAAKASLSGVDRTLAYVDPSPALGDPFQGAPTVTGLAGGTGPDAGRTVGPHGPYSHTQAQCGRAGSEYSSNSVGYLVQAYPLDEALPEYASFSRDLSGLWSVQDRVLKNMGRFARVQGRESGEDADANWRVRLQRAARDLSVRMADDFHFGIVGQQDLVEYGAAGRPNFLKRVLAAKRQASDAWQRVDDCEWRFFLIPGLGIN